jgi:hypothetical protein
MEMSTMKKTLIPIAIIAIALGLAATAAMAQDQDQTQLQTREQIRERIDQADRLTEQQREQMRDNLRECERLGLGVDEIDAIFPGAEGANGPNAEAMIRVQSRVMNMAREGLPAGAVVAKFKEGALKGVPGPALDGACERMENHVRAANRVMTRLRDETGEPAGDPAQVRRQTRELAQQMWRGMGEGDYDQLRERVRKQLRDGSCNTDDVVAGGELATRLREQGVERGRAIEIPGEALERGYRAPEMRHLQFMLTARRHNGPMDEFVADLEHCLGLGLGMGEMYQHMMQNGWMGPGDMAGPGGFHGGDDRGQGPGHGGDHDGGNQGGGGNGGSGGNGGDGQGGGGGGNGQHGG